MTNEVLVVKSIDLLQEQVETLVVLEPNSSHEIVEAAKNPAVLEVRTFEAVTEIQQEFVVVTEGVQGPPGPPGAPGQAGVSYVTFKASGPIGGHRAVGAVFSGYVKYSDSRNVAGATSVVGISLHAAEDGDPINVANSGEVIEPSWSWTQDLPIFVGAEGVLTQLPPDSGFQLVVAVATSPTSALLSIKQPIVI